MKICPNSDFFYRRSSKRKETLPGKITPKGEEII